MNKWMDKIAEYTVVGAMLVKKFALPLALVSFGLACLSAAMLNGYAAAVFVVASTYFAMLAVT